MYSGAVFSFDHNWTEPVIERLTWLTDVLQHRDASEQRRQPRRHSRRQLEYAALPVTQIERQRLDNFIWSKHKGAMLLPIWTDAQVLQSTAASGQPVVSISTPTYDYDAGQYLILWRDFETYEAVQIQSLISSAVTLSENLVATWTPGTIVCPARLARMSQSVQGQQHAHGVRPYRFQFDIDESIVSASRITAQSPSQYLSVDAFPSASDGGEVFDFSYQHLRTDIDYQTGAVAIDSGARPSPVLMIPYKEVFADRASVSNWLGFLDRRQGRRIPFWFPSWENDFEPLTINNGVNGSIVYDANGYAAMINAASGRKDLAIIYLQQGQVYAAGHQQYIRITAATDNGNGTETINCPLNFVYDEDKAKIKISFLRFCRMESDSIEIAWETTTVARTQTIFRELSNVP